MDHLTNRYDFIRERVRAKQVLDVGCCGFNVADGRKRENFLFDVLCETAENVCGMDLDAEQVAVLQKEGHPVWCMDAQEQMPSFMFDVIVAGNVIEHMECPADFLGIAVDHLNPGGEIIVTTGNPYALFNWACIGMFGVPMISAEHTMWLCPSTMRRMASAVGLRLKETYSFDHSRFALARLAGRIRRYWAADWLFVLEAK